jgi:hypothetical protein
MARSPSLSKGDNTCEFALGSENRAARITGATSNLTIGILKPEQD